MWVTEGLKTDPPAQTILADTGPITSSSINSTIIITSDVSLVVEIAQKDSSNLADVNVLILPIDSIPFFMVSLPFSFSLNQRLVIRTQTDLGKIERKGGITVQGSIFF